jgi:hypothetical protein
MDVELNTDLTAVLASLDAPPRGPQFALARTRILTIKAKAEDKASRRGIKALIRPENAQSILPHLPAPGEHTHCALCGDFVLCDIIGAILRHHPAAHCPDLFIATLGLSQANATALAKWKALGLLGSITIVASHYFARLEGGRECQAVASILKPVADLIITRCHAKIICLPIGSDHYVIEGSANIRSSDNTEQITLFNDATLGAFHREWLSSLPHHG